MDIPWSERVNMLQINPAAATLDDISRMATTVSAIHAILDSAMLHGGNTDKEKLDWVLEKLRSAK